jgi:peptidoglycan-associated lipoprotein
MNSIFRLLFAAMGMGILAHPAAGQSWIERASYPQWNTPSADFMHAPGIKPGTYHFVSNRNPEELPVLKIAGCKPQKMPYRVYRATSGEVKPVTDPGTERWAGVPVYSKDGQIMAVPVWSDSCKNGVARTEIRVYQALPANSIGAYLTYDEVPYLLAYNHGWPLYEQAQHPHFHPKTGDLVFSALRSGQSSYDLFASKGGKKDASLLSVSTNADEVYPTYWGDTLLYSVATASNGLDVKAFHQGACINLPAVVNTKQNDYNVWVISSDSAWINSTSGGNADLWYLFGPDDPQTAVPVASVPSKKGTEKTQSPQTPAPVEPAPLPVTRTPEPVQSPTGNSEGTYTVVMGSFKSSKAAALYIQDLKSKLPPQNALKINQANGNYRVGAEVDGPKSNALVALNEYRQLVPAAWLNTDSRSSGSRSNQIEIYFDFDQDVIRAGEATRIRNFMKALNGSAGTFDLAGHCDARGNYDYNVNLGFRRAEAVKNFIQQGYGPINANLSTRSESNLQTPCPDNTPCAEEQHQLNRRVVLTFYPN